MPPLPAKGECAIIEAAAHPQAPTLWVHTHQGYDDEIEPARIEGASIAVGHGYAEYAAPRLARERLEAQAAMTQVAHHGNENSDSAPACRDQESGRVGLSIKGQINGNAAARFESGQAADG